jgi:mRNA-degrading endonuclease RelE of RelBE toxin-antitoxin system
MAWTIRLSPTAAQQLAVFPRNHQMVIGKAIDRMAVNPFQGDVKPLKGRQWAGRFRKVVGDYWVIFTLRHAERIVEVSQILRRSEKTYRP